METLCMLEYRPALRSGRSARKRGIGSPAGAAVVCIALTWKIYLLALILPIPRCIVRTGLCLVPVRGAQSQIRDV